MKMKEFGPPGGAHVPGAPLRSANVSYPDTGRERLIQTWLIRSFT